MSCINRRSANMKLAIVPVIALLLAGCGKSAGTDVTAQVVHSRPATTAAAASPSPGTAAAAGTDATTAGAGAAAAGTAAGTAKMAEAGPAPTLADITADVVE